MGSAYKLKPISLPMEALLKRMLVRGPIKAARLHPDEGSTMRGLEGRGLAVRSGDAFTLTEAGTTEARRL